MNASEIKEYHRLNRERIPKGHDKISMGCYLTQELFKNCVNGKMICLSTGEIVEKSILIKRVSKGTYLEVRLKPEGEPNDPDNEQDEEEENRGSGWWGE